MLEEDILPFEDENGNRIEFFTGTTKVLTCTIVDDNDDAVDISGWDDIYFCATDELSSSPTIIFDVKAVKLSGTGQFTITLDATDLADSYDRIIVEFYETDDPVTYRETLGLPGQWTSRIRRSVKG